MFESFKKIWTLRDLRYKIIFTVLMLFLIRILAHIPIPGVNTESLRSFFGENQFFGILNMFSGGTMENFSIILMGVGPYITASIIIQLLQMVVPSLEAIGKEGEQGHQRMNYYTRLLTVPLGAIQSFAMIRLLESQNILTGLTFSQLVPAIITATAGTIFVMWIGELISERGIGNGISLTIALGIIAGLPQQVKNTTLILRSGDYPVLLILLLVLAIVVLVVGFIILITEGERQIPVSYARRVRGASSYGGVQSHLPLRINAAGVIPIIFALSLITFPPVIAQFLTTARTAWLRNVGTWVYNTFERNDLFYNISYFVLVVLFTFFYTFIVFKPKDVAENLQKNGGFVPGIRPGQETARYLTYVITRITVTGSIFLAIIAVLPFIVRSLTDINTISLGGTSILIVISVVIETMRQLQAQLVMRTYDNY